MGQDLCYREYGLFQNGCISPPPARALKAFFLAFNAGDTFGGKFHESVGDSQRLSDLPMLRLAHTQAQALSEDYHASVPTSY